MEKEEQNLSQQLTRKQEEITNYERVLREYAARGGGRWYDQGRRHLEDLRVELATLHTQAALLSV